MDSRQQERLLKEKIRGSGRKTDGTIFRVDLPLSAAKSGNDAVMGAHFGRADQRPEIDPEG
jgi:hypothetical protein